jgi:hypothetical protein
MKIINLLVNIFAFMNFRNFYFASKIVGKSILLGKTDSMVRKDIILKPRNQNQNQCIIQNKIDKIFCEKDKQLYLESNDFIMDKKLISISPGGFKGFYILGVITYIKENYPLHNFIFSGASAGAWNSLLMCYKKDPKELALKIMNMNIMESKNIHDMEYTMKYKLLEICKNEDFDLQRLFIGVTTVHKMKLITNIFSDFNHLEDAINCCIASSHIPFITGGFTNRYHNMYTFDGGFSEYPYLNIKQPVLHISPSMWKEIGKTKGSIRQMFVYNKVKQFISFYNLITENTQKQNNNLNFMKLYDDGYHDAKMNKKMLDEILLDDYYEII